MTTIKEKANAKINLYLDVISKREDGFHDIKTIMHSYKEELKDMSLPIVLGVGDNYKPMIIDLAKVGHILVGGATSQGKTNLLHAFAQSIYYSPRKVSEGYFVYYI